MTSGVVVGQLVHGYARGHELLGASLELADEDADLIAQLSDLSGMPVEERTPSYVTCYPLPSGALYAVAGTWMDDEAPRDGCVLTHTLLVPMAEWCSGISAGALVASLRKPIPPSRDSPGRPRRLAPVEVGPHGSRPIGVTVPSSPRFSDFVVAYFGHGRKPSVWLDGPPDGNLASLLLDFAWPSLRRDIALCTYALKPRSILGRPFDVQFAPRSAAGRFSYIPERNIVGLSPRRGLEPSGRDARLVFRVAAELAAVDAHEKNRRWDTYARLWPDLPRNPDAPMKLIVLEEMRNKAETSPTAAVAVLDALAAIVPAMNDGLADKSAALEAALIRTMTQPPGFTIELLGAIADRCSKQAFRRFSGRRRRIIDHVSQLVALDPLACLSTVSRMKGRHVSLMTGVAAGLAAGDGDGAIHLDRLEEVRPDAVDTLIRLRPGLVALYLRVHGILNPAGDGEFVDRVAGWLRRSTTARRRTLARHIAKSPSASVSASVLVEVIPDLGRADRRHAITVALDVATSSVGQVKSDAFWSMLDATVERFPAEIRDAVSTFGLRSFRLARLWAVTYADQQVAVENLPLAHPAMPCARQFAMSAILDLWGPEVLDPRLVAESTAWVAEILRTRCTYDSPEVVRLLSAMLKIGDHEELVLQLSPHDCELEELDASTSHVLGVTLAESVLVTFCSGLIDEARMRAWLSDGAVANAVQTFQVSRVIERCEVARRRSIDQDAWALRVWQWLGGMADLLRGQRDGVAVDLVDWAFNQTMEAWNFSMTSLWVGVVEASREGGEGERIGRVEAHAINSAMTHAHLPLSALVVMSFPRLYLVVEHDQPLLPLFAMWFPDWDKAKQLRKRLVSVFLCSDWPAGDLALTASAAGILDKIVARLRRKGHEPYLDAMVTDLRQKAGRREMAIAGRVTTFRYKGAPSWD